MKANIPNLINVVVRATIITNSKIPGVIRVSRAWLIPKDAEKPRDGRYKNGRVPTKNKAENKENK